MAQYTDITILLDRSGSMQTIKTAMESGMKEFIQGHQTVPSTRLSLIQFDGTNSYEEVYIERPITDVPELILSPRGWTPLYDALCKTIDKTGQRLAAKREADRPDKVLFLIITDGEENASREFKRHDARTRIERQKDRYQWEFSYLGANQDAYKEAQSIGIDWGKTMNFNASLKGVSGAMRGMTTNTVAYASTTGTGAMANYTKSQLDAAVEDDKGTSGKP